MKGSILLAAVLVLACGCDILEDGFFNGQRREVRPGRGNGDNSRPDVSERDTSDTGGSQILRKPDTTIYCSAVRCPDDYDWQRDTACNTVSCEVLLFKNGKEVLSIPAGKGCCISPAPDLHHIIDGHLFTEYCTLTETVICRDGEEILRFKGNEILKGLVCRDGHIYTLARKRDGTGFTYREDGEIKFVQSNIHVFGGFDNQSYPTTGGLYIDGHDIVFCYKSNGTNAACHAVCNGQSRELSIPGNEIMDIKIKNGEVLKVSRDDKLARWTEADAITDSIYIIAGQASKWACVATEDNLGIKRICKGEATIYCSAEKAVAVHCDETGMVSVHYSSTDEQRYEGTWHLFTTDCCAMVGDELLVGLSPKERDERAKLCLGARTIELEGLGNGFITGVAGIISLPK